METNELFDAMFGENFSKRLDQGIKYSEYKRNDYLLTLLNGTSGNGSDVYFTISKTLL